MGNDFWKVLNVILIVLIGLAFYVIGYAIAWLLEYIPYAF